ncbi:MAG: glycosyltransferase family 39 protein, partial [Chloroflexi bacterium]|nr:glycosyltransferase family 39 protein [Chloroflexota bacterium]
MARNDKSLRVALIAFIAARIALSAWAWIVLQMNPLIVSNLNLFGEQVVVAFDMQAGQRAVFARLVDGRELHFRAAPPNLVDGETNRMWDLNGRANDGAQLALASRASEEIFPYRGVAIETNSLLAPWQRFDANWYLKIAQRGYSADDGSTVYFPLYPLLIRIFGGGLLAAIVISNLALIGVFYLVYQLGKDLMGEKFAARALAYLAIFPTAFFLFAPYTESLFLFFALASIHAAAKEKFPRASIFAALAALTRLQGALLIFPLAYLVWKKNNAARLTLEASRSFSYTFRNTFFLALIPLA